MANDILYGEVGAKAAPIELLHFTPNFELIGKVLDTKQKKYDTNLMMLSKVKAKTDEVNSLEGYDRDRWLTKQQGYDDKVNQIMRLYDGDLSKADGELNNFVFDMSRDFGTHGEATAIHQRHAGYTADEKELSKRRAENKITEGQYQMLGRELRTTAATGIGTDKNNWNPWNRVNPTDKVDVEKFMNDFVKNKEAELSDDGFTPFTDPVTGKVGYKNQTHDFKDYNSILEEGTTALHNKMKETGQLNADYLHHQDLTGSKPDRNKYLGEFGKQSAVLKAQLEAISTLSGKELQKKLVELGANITITGTYDKKTQQVQKAFKQQLTEQLEINQKNQEVVSGYAEDQLNQYDFDNWSTDNVTNLVKPWAGAVSRDRFVNKLQAYNNPYLDHSLKLKAIDHEYKLKRNQFDYEWTLNNPVSNKYTIGTQGMEIRGEHGSLEEIQAKIDGTAGAEKEATRAFAALFPDLLGVLPGNAGTFIKDKDLMAFASSNGGIDLNKLANARAVENPDGTTSVHLDDGKGNTKEFKTDRFDIDVFNKIQANAVKSINDRKMALKIKETAMSEIADARGYSAEEKAYFMNSPESFENKATPDLRKIYDVYIANYKKDRSVNVLGNNINLFTPSFEEFKENIGNKKPDFLLQVKAEQIKNMPETTSAERQAKKEASVKINNELTSNMYGDYAQYLQDANGVPLTIGSRTALDVMIDYGTKKSNVNRKQSEFNSEVNTQLERNNKHTYTGNPDNVLFGGGVLPKNIYDANVKEAEGLLNNQANWINFTGYSSGKSYGIGEKPMSLQVMIEENAKKQGLQTGTVKGYHSVKTGTPFFDFMPNTPSGEPSWVVPIIYTDKEGRTIGNFDASINSSSLSTSLMNRPEYAVYRDVLPNIYRCHKQGMRETPPMMMRDAVTGDMKMYRINFGKDLNADFNKALSHSTVEFITPNGDWSSPTGYHTDYNKTMNKLSTQATLNDYSQRLDVERLSANVRMPQLDTKTNQLLAHGTKAYILNYLKQHVLDPETLAPKRHLNTEQVIKNLSTVPVTIPFGNQTHTINVKVPEVIIQNILKEHVVAGESRTVTEPIGRYTNSASYGAGYNQANNSRSFETSDTDDDNNDNNVDED